MVPAFEPPTPVAAIFARQSGCVVCQDGAPTCPSCPSGQECQVTVPLDCTQCPQAYCTDSSPPATASVSSTKASSTGAIAGAAVGGVALVSIVGLVTYFVWRFCIKNKRQQQAEKEQWDYEQDNPRSQQEKDFAAKRDQRASTHTVNSMASTVLTRASNIIQIAYIPGVTNRATPTSPTLLVPPVPPIPIAMSQANSPAATEDQHFFVPGDLRDSTYSGISVFSDRTSYAQAAYGPRSSVASTIYGKSGIVVTPAQTGMRAKAAMVSVRTTASGGSINSSFGEGSTPPVPALNLKKYEQGPPSPSGSTFSVGSTFLNNASSANTATAIRAQVVRVGSSNLKQSSTPNSGDSGPSTPKAATLVDISPTTEQDSPFSDPPTDRRHASNTSLSAVIEEATRRASRRASNQVRGSSPFGDEHATT